LLLIYFTVICSEGEQNEGNSCSLCPQGTWSNGNMTVRFEQCYNCTQDYTTVGMRSTHPDNCTLSKFIRWNDL